jgi:NAD(P)-dependent dehydrogenase (short-subunit alcohol dehydrogenase family)
MKLQAPGENRSADNSPGTRIMNTLRTIAALTGLLCIAGTAAAADDTARAFTAKDLVMLDRVSDPQVAPDGQSVVFTVRETRHGPVIELLKTKGSIIVTLSNSSFYPDGGGVMYIASKHAALGVVRQLAHEFAPFIRVNGVSPGATKTDIRMAASFGKDEKGEPIRTHVHPSNLDAAVEAVTPLKMHAHPRDHAGAYVLLGARRESPLPQTPNLVTNLRGRSPIMSERARVPASKQNRVERGTAGCVSNNSTTRA